MSSVTTALVCLAVTAVSVVVGTDVLKGQLTTGGWTFREDAFCPAVQRPGEANCFFNSALSQHAADAPFCRWQIEGCGLRLQFEEADEFFDYFVADGEVFSPEAGSTKTAARFVFWAHVDYFMGQHHRNTEDGSFKFCFQNEPSCLPTVAAPSSAIPSPSPKVTSRRYHKRKRSEAYGGRSRRSNADSDTSVSVASSTAANCLPGEAIVHPAHVTGSSEVKKLQQGDYVLSQAADEVQVFEKVIGFLHVVGRSEHLTVEHTAGNLRISSNHMLFADNVDKPARAIKTGSWVRQSDGRRARVLVVTTDSTNSGMYSPLVADGRLLVDGTVCSSYSAPGQEDIKPSFLLPSYWSRAFTTSWRRQSGRHATVLPKCFVPLASLCRQKGQAEG
eukprot:TRINITY_DN2955_c0_g1_i13.p1 TRINITY_DN2955_c0_g1~~TRINITY_DN2955_c0_g1_i13.p1  ORF type:complete len:389 (+),score=42.54 TRINITY_DN2955_c0_g1_i13:93-1259(+)